MTRLMPTQNRDYTPTGARYVIWWAGDDHMEYTGFSDVLTLPVSEQAREMGRYLCSAGPSHVDAHVEVVIEWHHGQKQFMVTGYAETHRRLKRWTGSRPSFHTSLVDAVACARAEAKLLHRWLNSGGTLPLPAVPVFGVAVPMRSVAELQAEEARLLAQQARLRDQSGQGSKAGIASRNARRDQIGDRLYQVRGALQEVAS